MYLNVWRQEGEYWSGRIWSEELISMLAPLLENCPPSPEMCRFFSRHCVAHPRSPLVSDALTPVVHRILKHNVVSTLRLFSISSLLLLFLDSEVGGLPSRNQPLDRLIPCLLYTSILHSITKTQFTLVIH